MCAERGGSRGSSCCPFTDTSLVPECTDLWRNVTEACVEYSADFHQLYDKIGSIMETDLEDQLVTRVLQISEGYVLLGQDLFLKVS